MSAVVLAFSARPRVLVPAPPGLRWVQPRDVAEAHLVPLDGDATLCRRDLGPAAVPRRFGLPATGPRVCPVCRSVCRSREGIE